MRVYLPRFFVRQAAGNLLRFAEDCAEAAAAGAQLAIFPEQFVTGYREDYSAVLIREQFAAVSARHPELTICCGTLTEDGQNWQCWYRAGECIAAYAKVHLFHPNGEHELWRSGKEYVRLELDGLALGLGTCNDLRFPEQMHTLSRSGKLGLLVYPALWPWQRDHVWAALLRARAIEHGAFSIGCCVAGVDNGLERFDGAGNYVFDPRGVQVLPEGRLYRLDLSLLDQQVVDTAAQYLPVEQVKIYRSTQE